jgi:hypothetical protein
VYGKDNRSKQITKKIIYIIFFQEANMKMTDHAKGRQKQRGISNMAMNIIEQNGRCEKAPGGALKIFFGFKEYQRTIEDLKKTIQLLDKVKGGTLIINEEKIITVYRS